MRLPFRARPQAFAAAMAVVFAVSGAAVAGSLHKERAYSDSYGNLVIHSPAGYKRIVVGQGWRAGEYEPYQEPEVLSYHKPHPYPHFVHCNQPPVLLKGRSYMYGLADGELPAPAGLCR